MDAARLVIREFQFNEVDTTCMLISPTRLMQALKTYTSREQNGESMASLLEAWNCLNILKTTPFSFFDWLTIAAPRSSTTQMHARTIAEIMYMGIDEKTAKRAFYAITTQYRNRDGHAAQLPTAREIVATLMRPRARQQLQRSASSIDPHIAQWPAMEHVNTLVTQHWMDYEVAMEMLMSCGRENVQQAIAFCQRAQLRRQNAAVVNPQLLMEPDEAAI